MGLCGCKLRVSRWGDCSRWAGGGPWITGILRRWRAPPKDWSKGSWDAGRRVGALSQARHELWDLEKVRRGAMALLMVGFQLRETYFRSSIRDAFSTGHVVICHSSTKNQMYLLLPWEVADFSASLEPGSAPFCGWSSGHTSGSWGQGRAGRGTAKNQIVGVREQLSSCGPPWRLLSHNLLWNVSRAANSKMCSCHLGEERQTGPPVGTHGLGHRHVSCIRWVCLGAK